MRAFVKYYLFWLLFFLLQKPLFMLIHLPLMGDVRWSDWCLVPWHALPLDLSVASYVMVLFGLLLVVLAWVKIPHVERGLDVYTGLLLLVGLAAFIGDCGVFPSWGFHLDKTIFVYISTPKEMFACAEWWLWLVGLAALIIGWGVCFAAYRWVMCGWSQTIQRRETGFSRTAVAMAWLLVTGALFLPIRGSVTTSTMNTGRVYFSNNQMCNLAAINPLFNIIESLGENTFDVEKYTYMPSEKAQALVDELLPSESESMPQILTTTRPDIVLCILESFSSNAWQAMPNLQRLAEEGVYFSNAYASSYRTDRGVVAVLSAFPGQPTSSLMLVPYKSQHLPQLGKSLAKEGYQLKFWYGGDEDFTNMRSYLVNGGFAERICDRSFPVSQRLSKWGVQDHLLFARAAEEMAHRQSAAPTLDVLLSLSSHEPFDVPASRRFDNPYLNAVAYTDSCLGALVDTLRCSPRWANTLIICIADHGYPYPPHLHNHEPQRYALPMLFAGGAVKQPQRVEQICSQIDLVPTLLAQMQISHAEYTFAKNVLDSAAVPFAFYSFNDGFGLITSTDTVVVDAKANRLLIGTPSHAEQQSRAFMQRIMERIEKM